MRVSHRSVGLLALLFASGCSSTNQVKGAIDINGNTVTFSKVECSISSNPLGCDGLAIVFESPSAGSISNLLAIHPDYQEFDQETATSVDVTSVTSVVWEDSGYTPVDSAAENSVVLSLNGFPADWNTLSKQKSFSIKGNVTIEPTTFMRPFDAVASIEVSAEPVSFECEVPIALCD